MISQYRGLIIVLTTAYGPFCVAWAIFVVTYYFRLPGVGSAFGVALLWSFVTLPHLWTSPQLVDGFWLARFVPLLQWTLVGLVVTRFTRRQSTSWTLAIAIAATLSVAALTHVLLRALGYDIYMGSL